MTSGVAVEHLEVATRKCCDSSVCLRIDVEPVSVVGLTELHWNEVPRTFKSHELLLPLLIPLHPICSSPDSCAPKSHNLPLARCCQHGTHGTNAYQQRSRYVERGPSIHELVHRLTLRSVCLEDFIFQGRGCKLVFLGHELSIRGGNHEHCKRHDAREQNGGGQVQAECCRAGVF